MKHHGRMQRTSDLLVGQVVRGEETASVVALGEVDVKEGDYDDPLVFGELYDVYYGTLVKRATVRIIGMELSSWENIPERLWRGEVNADAGEFRRHHLDYLQNPGPGFEFVVRRFRLVEPDIVT